MLIFGVVASVCCSCSKTAHTTGQVEGQYELFNALRPHSLDVVRLDVYEDFTCPPCQQFSNDFLPPLRQAYGSQVDIHFHYMAGSKSPVSAQVLYDIAAAHGKGTDAAARLFAAKLDHRDAQKNAPLVESVANELGLGDEYRSALANPDTEKRIRETWNRDGAAIAFFPSLVIADQLLTNSNPDNVHTIINSLLKNPRRHISVATGAAKSTGSTSVPQDSPAHIQ